MADSWHTKTAGFVFESFDTSERGLSGEEAKRRLARNGPNALPEPPRDGILRIFIRQFESPLVYVLIAAALVVFLMNETTDAAVILFVLIFNATVGAIQEGKAENTLRVLRRFVET